jgi:hypothetical protein
VIKGSEKQQNFRLTHARHLKVIDSILEFFLTERPAVVRVHNFELSHQADKSTNASSRESLSKASD